MNQTLTTSAAAKARSNRFDVSQIRFDFPILEQRIRGKPLIYFDNAATSQKPQVVIDALMNYYKRENANIHRGVYQLSLEASTAYEEAREEVARFINAADAHECLFTRGTTESINLLASTWGRANLKAGDEIILSALEHHSNIVPWQMCCALTGAIIRVAPIDDRGTLILEEYQKLLSPRTKLVAMTHQSNALGTMNDIKLLARLAHEQGALFLADGAQWVTHHPTDVQDLNVDFYAFSGHKLYGPTGIGVLYGKRKWLEKMPPYQGGGDMIESVSFEKTTYAGLPNKFEAGTPHIAGVIGLHAAINYLRELGMENIAAHEETLLLHATRRLQEVQGLRLVGTSPQKSGVISFLLESPCIAPVDVGAELDLDGIAVRTGHHCCQPLMNRLHITGTIRMSFGLYNTIEEIDAIVASLKRIRTKKQAEIPRCAELPMQADVRYPEAAASTPNAAASELIDAFQFLADWPQRYEYIIDLGKKMLPLPESEKVEANRIKGCQSTVFLSARKRPGSHDIMDFLAYSNADIVSGLIAILQRVYSGQKAKDILAFDIDGFFQQLGIDQNLAMQRRIGLGEMVKRIQQLALALEHSAATCTNQDCAHCQKDDRITV